MTATRHLFLDLEDTVITPVMDGWFNTHIVNSEKIKALIAEFKPDYIHLFSFAVWNKLELTRFDLGTRPQLEKHFGIKFSTTWTVDDDIIPMCCSVMGLGQGSVDFMEMSNFWSKHEAFRLSMRHHFKGVRNHPEASVEVMLLDDAVLNESFEWPDLKIKGRIINIDQWELPCQVSQASSSTTTTE